MKITGATAGADGKWESVGADPYFEFSLWPVRPAFLLFAVGSQAATADVQVYFNLGAGYNERDSLSMEFGRDTVGCLPLRAIEGSRLRIDPVNKPGPFSFETSMVWRAGALGAGIAKFRDRHRLGPDGEVRDCSPANILFRDKPLLRDFGSRPGQESTRHSGSSLPVSDTPLISFVVPVYNGKAHHLQQLISSIFDWKFGSIELVLSDDGSTSPETLAALTSAAAANGDIRVFYSANTGYGGAVNRGVGKARGKWVAIIDHDDFLTAGAVGHLFEALSAFRDARMFYTDELIVGSRGKIVDIMAKPVFDPVLLSGVNYVNHLSVYDRSRFIAVGGMRQGYRGSQDYDLVLRYTEGLSAQEIVHIPFPAYTWRREGETFSKTYLEECTTSARDALAEYYSPLGEISFGPALQPDYHKLEISGPKSPWPSVSVVIATDCGEQAIRETIGLLKNATDYDIAELIVCALDGIDQEPKSAADASDIPTMLIDCRAADISGAISAAIGRSVGEWVVVLTQAMRPAHPGWLRELVSCTYFPGVGLVAPRCVDGEGRLVNAGMVQDGSRNLVEWYKRQPLELAGGLGMLQLRHTVSAASSQCLLLSKECFEATGPLSQGLANSWSLDYCERAGLAGYRTVWTPEATIVLSGGEENGRQEADERTRQVEGLNSEGCCDDYASPWFNIRHGVPLVATDNSVPDGRIGKLRLG